MNTNTSINLRPRMLMLLAAPLATAIMMALPTAAHAGIDVSINIAPPEIPVYEQPPIPGDGYIWTPGYWAYADGDYFWVPGTWVRPPTVGFLWTPGYWGYDGGLYVFHTGYWGPHIGFYGGVNYGFGYGGRGYEGGYWNHGAFFYNRNVNAIGSVRIVNVYERPVTNITIERVSFNGGPGGVNVRINADEERAEHERHVQPIPEQRQQREMASTNKDLRASVNHGAPAIAATPKPGVFEGPGVVKARGANEAGHDAANPREDAQAKAGASASADQEAAKSREDAQMKANASASSDRDAARSRDDAQMQEKMSNRDNAKTREDAQKGDAAANAAPPKPHRPRNPRPENSYKGGAASMSSDRMGANGNAERPEETRQPQRAARPENAPRPMNEGQPRAMKPEHPAEAPKNEEKSKKEDEKKQQ